MYQTVTAVALRTVKYGDSRSIVTVWSAQLGRLSITMPSGNGPESRRRRALTMPLGIFDATVDVRPDRDIFTARDMTAHHVLTALRTNPVKMMIAQFLAEALDAILREAGIADPLLWQYIEQSIIALDAMPTQAAVNFHLMFLARLTQLLGIEPDTSGCSPNAVFDMIDGRFRSTPPAHGQYAEATCSEAIGVLMALNRRNLRCLRLSRTERAALLDGILTYYTLHHIPLSNLHSLTVLRTL